jgi:hypothetical protein
VSRFPLFLNVVSNVKADLLSYGLYVYTDSGRILRSTAPAWTFAGQIVRRREVSGEAVDRILEARDAARVPI